jgi:hypothetical protein
MGPQLCVALCFGSTCQMGASSVAKSDMADLAGVASGLAADAVVHIYATGQDGVRVECIIDPSFAEQWGIARPTPAYAHVVAALPQVRSSVVALKACNAPAALMLEPAVCTSATLLRCACLLNRRLAQVSSSR